MSYRTKGGGGIIFYWQLNNMVPDTINHSFALRTHLYSIVLL